MPDNEITASLTPAPSEDLRRELEDAFAEVGIEVEVGSGVAKGVVVPDWVLYVGTPVLGALISRLTDDAVDKLKRLVKSVFRAMHPAGTPGAVDLRIRDAKAAVILTDDLPDEAYRKLLREPLPRHTQSGELRWDSERGEWRDPLDFLE